MCTKLFLLPRSTDRCRSGMTFFGVRHEGDVGHESGVGEPARQPRFVHLEPLLVAA